MSVKTADTEKKILCILKALNSVQHPMGSHRISEHLNNEGTVLSEGTVRQLLMLMDIRGLTELVGHREGRVITAKGRNELEKPEVSQ